jgi:hypothetical protein
MTRKPHSDENISRALSMRGWRQRRRHLAHVVHMPAAGDPGRTRTCDPLLRRQMLYPTELRGL